MNISTDGMIAAIRSAAERVEPRESEVLNGIADRIAELVASSNKNRRTAKHYERECLEWQGKYSAAEKKLLKPVMLPQRYSFDCGVCADPNGEWLELNDVKEAIRVAGFTTQDGAE
ncbi:hypothetical protein V1951_12820 [Yersinia sp. 2544 StPb PI]|uniref:hypothetical protein n=1 Tax=Yersinia sp. 2544 StPb PI TaxID=3117409 RepID=UPI003B284C7E